MAATLLTAALILPFHGHSEADIDRWLRDWEHRAIEGLDQDLLAGWRDFAGRHPDYFDLQIPTTAPRALLGASQPARRADCSGNVEQWRPLVARYFPASQVEKALAVLSCETGGTGDPNSKNPRSSAAGLWQFLRSTWDWVAGELNLPTYDQGGPYDPELSTKAAAWLWGQYGWSQWSCG